MAIYSVDWMEEINEREAYFPTIFEIIFGVFKKKARPNLREWLAVIYTHNGEKSYGMLSAKDHDVQLLGFSQIATGSEILALSADGTAQKIRIGETLSLQGWCTKCLNGAVRWKRSVELM